MADNTEKKAGKRTGALHSDLKIELHTHYATGLWQGRRAEKADKGAKEKPAIMGMPLFLHLASRINQDSLKNNPWADAAMLALEEKIGDAGEKMSQLIASLDKAMQVLPPGVSVSDVVVREPLDIRVDSNTPLGYRYVYLLIGFDQFAKKVQQAFHFKQVNEVVIATDADREGEVIARELLDFCQWHGPVDRLWLSALDEQSIRAALASIRKVEETLFLYYAGLGRSRADWLNGMVRHEVA